METEDGFDDFRLLDDRNATVPPIRGDLQWWKTHDVWLLLYIFSNPNARCCDPPHAGAEVIPLTSSERHGHAVAIGQEGKAEDLDGFVLVADAP